LKTAAIAVSGIAGERLVARLVLIDRFDWVADA
jgi:hypothetical protein